MNKKMMKTYSKKAVKALLVIGVLNAEVPYILALIGREPCIEMGVAWITEVVAVILGYLCKAFFETKQKRKQDLLDFKAGMMSEDNYDGNDVG